MEGRSEEAIKGAAEATEQGAAQSPRSPSSSSSPAAVLAGGFRPFLKKQMSAKVNCLCSPTTHAGSFRCRHHRAAALRNSNSVGSGLSELVKKSSPVDGRMEVEIL